MNAAPKAFTAQLLAAIPLLKRRRGLLTWDVSDATTGVLGLNTAAVGGGAFEINPVIGVHHHEIERRVAELRDVPHPSAVPMTIAANIGYLMPERRYRAFFVSEDRSRIAEEATELARLWKVHAVPFVRAHSTIESIIDCIEHDGPARALSQDFALPAAYLVGGNPLKARAYVCQKLVEAHGQDNAWVANYREFARRVDSAANVMLSVNTTLSGSAKRR